AARRLPAAPRGRRGHRPRRLGQREARTALRPAPVGGRPLPPGVAVRVFAARVLDAILHRGRSLQAELGSALPTLSDPRDRALVEAICFAALRQRARCDAALAAWMPRPLPRRDRPLRALLHARMAPLDPLALPPHTPHRAT